MKIFAKTKIWIIVALVVVLIGAIFVSVFGLNQTPDYKTAYEVTIGVDQNVQGSGKVAKNAAEDYFKSVGYKYSGYATQKTADGTEYIYKSHKAGDVNEADLLKTINDALAADENLGGLGLVAKAEYKKTEVTADYSALKVVLACALGLIAAFIIAFFTVKAASALTLLCNALMTAVLYVMLLAVTRIPALPDVVIGGAIGVIVSCVMTFVLACRYKEILKAGNADFKAVAEEGLNCGAARLIFIACVCAFAAIALSVAGGVYVTFTGLKILVAVASAFLVSCVATPSLWTALKTVKLKK